MNILKAIDVETAYAIEQELNRQRNKIELIASENFVSKAVMIAQGSVLTNKYAEGYPGHRYYGGCEYVDIVEQLAIDRTKELFGAEHANVQPHSGSNANTAIYYGFLKPGDTIMGMNLAHGGHLSHGSPVNISGKYFNVIPYSVKLEDCLIDYDEVRMLAIKYRPKMIVAGASAYPRIIDFALIGSIAREVGALYMVDMAHIAGLVAAGLHPSPIAHADFVTTTTHKTLRGPRGGLIMCKAQYAKKVDKAIFPGLQGGPFMHVIAGKAVALKEALTDEFKAYQKQILKNCLTLSKKLKSFGFNLVSGGSDNHLMLVDVRKHNLTGKLAEYLLDEIGITVNKNAIPFDTVSPQITSGIRIGTPAVTSRGMKEETMEQIGDIINLVFSKPKDTKTKIQAAKMVKDICEKHPLYINK